MWWWPYLAPCCTLQGTKYSCPRHLFMAGNFWCLLLWRWFEGKDYLLWTRSCYHVQVENNIAPRSNIYQTLHRIWPTLVLWNLFRPSVSLGLLRHRRRIFLGDATRGAPRPRGVNQINKVPTKPQVSTLQSHVILLMAEILHQLRLVVFPIIYRVSAPSQVVVWDFSHQQYHCTVFDDSGF